MKSCPTCNRTYPDDTLAFCLVDGAVLSAPFDPEKTQRIPTPRTTIPAATEMLPDPRMANEPEPRLQSTIRVPQPKVPPLYSQKQADYPGERRSLAPWLIIGGAVLLVGVFTVVMLVTRWPANQNTNRTDANSGNKSSPEKQAGLACSQSLSSALYDKWIEMGGENGRLGCPITAETEAPGSPQGTTGRWVQFQKGDGGYLVWHQSGPNAGKAVEVSGCMFKLYADLGGTRSWLGFPLSDGREITTGARQDFEGGYVVWDSKTYVCKAHKN